MNQTLSDPDSSVHTSHPQLHRSTRTRQASTYLQDYHRDLTSLTANAFTTVRYPLNSVLSYSCLSPSHLHFVMSISSTTEPTSSFGPSSLSTELWCVLVLFKASPGFLALSFVTIGNIVTKPESTHCFGFLKSSCSVWHGFECCQGSPSNCLQSSIVFWF